MNATMEAGRTLLPIFTSAQTRWAMWHLVRGQKWRLLGTALVLLGASTAGLATPLFLGLLVDIAQRRGDPAGLLLAALGLVTAGLLAAGLGMMGQNLLARLCEETLADLREDAFAAMVRQPLATLEKAGTGDAVARVSGDVEAVGEAISSVLPAFTGAVFTIAVTVVGLGVMDWRFAVAALMAVPLQVFSLRWFLGRTRPVYRTVRIAEAHRTERLLETVEGASTAVALGRAGHQSRLVADASQEAIRHSILGIDLLTRFYNRLNYAELIGLAAVLAVGFWLHGQGVIGLGEATAAALCFHRLFDPIGLVLGEFDELQKAGAGLARIFGVIDAGERLKPMAGSRHSVAPQAVSRSSPAQWPEADVVFEGVSFSYEGRGKALEGIDLRVAPGERVVVVGSSGAGKSSLAKLALGIHPADGGTVRIAGLEVARAPEGRLRELVALVSQEVHVFRGSLADDLRLAKPEATEDEQWAALEAVGAAGWVKALDDGLETRVGAGGRTLPAGQAQQLALARLILSDPPVAILDEATAEAGSGPGQVLDRAAEAALAGRTGLVIAHRLTQAVTADRVVVMAQGRIVESGSHGELLRNGGLYAELWEAWDRPVRRG